MRCDFHQSDTNTYAFGQLRALQQLIECSQTIWWHKWMLKQKRVPHELIPSPESNRPCFSHGMMIKRLWDSNRTSYIFIQEMHFELSAKWRPFCLGLYVLKNKWLDRLFRVLVHMIYMYACHSMFTFTIWALINTSWISPLPISTYCLPYNALFKNLWLLYRSLNQNYCQ